MSSKAALLPFLLAATPLTFALDCPNNILSEITTVRKSLPVNISTVHALTNSWHNLTWSYLPVWNFTGDGLTIGSTRSINLGPGFEFVEELKGLKVNQPERTFSYYSSLINGPVANSLPSPPLGSPLAATLASSIANTTGNATYLDANDAYFNQTYYNVYQNLTILSYENNIKFTAGCDEKTTTLVEWTIEFCANDFPAGIHFFQNTTDWATDRLADRLGLNGTAGNWDVGCATQLADFTGTHTTSRTASSTRSATAQATYAARKSSALSSQQIPTLLLGLIFAACALLA